MSLDIYIHGHDPERSTYYAGDCVSGTVHLKGPIRSNDFTVVLNFFGGSFVFMPERGKEHDDYNNDEDMSWGFCLKFPSNTGDTGPLGPDKPSGAIWTTDSHPLPPSINFTHRHTLGRGYSSQIKYGLIATAWGTSVKLSKKHYLKFRALREYNDLSIPQSIVQIRIIDFEGRSSSGKFFGWLKNKKQCPHISPRVHVKMIAPEVMDLDTKAKIGLSFSQELDGWNGPHRQGITLLSVKHEIIEETWSRIPRDGHQDRIWSEISSIKKFRYDIPRKITGTDKTIDLTDDLNIVLSKELWTPSFRTYAISKKYRSFTTIKLKYMDEIRKIRFRVDNLEVLPTRRDRAPRQNSWTSRACFRQRLGEYIKVPRLSRLEDTYRPEEGPRHMVCFPVPEKLPVVEVGFNDDDDSET
ncbi:hypothetical protein ACMFMF_004795 [Clarireedia jacksonii]